MSTRASSTTLLLRYLRPHRGRLAMLAAATLCASLLPLALPGLLGTFVDRAVRGAAVSSLAGIAGAYVTIAIVAQLVTVAATYAATSVGWTVTNAIRSDLASHTVRLGMDFHQRHSPGAMIVRIDGDVTALSDFFSVFVLTVGGSMVTLLGVVAIVWTVDWRVGITLAVFAAVAVLLLTRLHAAAVPAATAARRARAKLYGDLEERLDGLDDLRANAGGDHALRGFHRLARDVYTTTIRSHQAGGRIWSTVGVLFTVGYAAAIGVSGFLHRGGALSIGAVFAVFHYTQMLRPPIERIADQAKQYQDAQSGAVRAAGLLATRPTLPDRGEDRLPDGPLDVRLDGVTFAYGDRPVLRDVDLSVPAGAVLGLVGRTGSGKTTIGRLVGRLYDPTKGQVRLGGVDCARVPLDEVHATVAYVTQEVQLFRLSVRDNVALFRDGVTDQTIVDALDAVGLGPWLAGLPGGLDTPLVHAQDDMSAGEAQLVALARVFVADPRVVVLDEATSRLDPRTEARLGTAVARLLQGRTAVVIAHRLSTLRDADAVAVVADGRIVERGAPDLLASDPASQFAAFLHAAAHGSGAFR